MFKAKDTVVGLLDNMNGEYRFYVVLKVYRDGLLPLYDIRAVKTGIHYYKVPLPDEFYRKLDKVR
jgi:hypothetical protein